jgi:hypothetical protein
MDPQFREPAADRLGVARFPQISRSTRIWIRAAVRGSLRLSFRNQVS